MRANSKHTNCMIQLLFVTQVIVYFCVIFQFWQQAQLSFILISCIMLIGAQLAIAYLFHFKHKQTKQHLSQVVKLNDSVLDLIKLSSQYKDEQMFLDSLLHKTISHLANADMGCIIKVYPNHKLKFTSVINLDIDKLSLINFTLEQSFNFRFTQGRCDQVVIIDDIQTINAETSISNDDQALLISAPNSAIHSTLSGPIHVDGQLYAMINIDSSKNNSFNEYDKNLLQILCHEASNAIAIYHKTAKIQKLANMDALTGLYNRKFFNDAYKRWKSHTNVSYLIIIDMNDLKLINDIYGHQQGDCALKALAKTMQKVWHNDQILARLGGDEFVVLSNDKLDDIKQQLHTIQQLLTKHHHYPILFSYGYSIYSPDWSSTFTAADSMMYQNKRQHKCQCA
ncbi:sensor domain-containing diguanylate cyclase [Shewanella marina]|uniref:sensor domain-containing diguanylate cyclase n=1 Tax=Shewanella marina TaxID=487319 RepID=UPI0006857F25|nr:sensor domain-containing diguanylate cyclase [Shewanella marina]